MNLDMSCPRREMPSPDKEKYEASWARRERCERMSLKITQNVDLP